MALKRGSKHTKKEVLTKKVGRLILAIYFIKSKKFAVSDSDDEEIPSDTDESIARCVFDYIYLFFSEASVEESEDEFADETPHERHVRLTKKALAEALKTGFLMICLLILCS